MKLGRLCVKLMESLSLEDSESEVHRVKWRLLAGAEPLENPILESVSASS